MLWCGASRRQSSGLIAIYASNRGAPRPHRQDHRRLASEFASIVAAARCAVEVQQAMAERNASVPEAHRIEFRIGINVRGPAAGCSASPGRASFGGISFQNLSVDPEQECLADGVVEEIPPPSADQLIRNPILVVEMLSPSTANFERKTKGRDYHGIPSVREILLFHSAKISAEILRREGERWITEIMQSPGAKLSLNSVPLTKSMASLYEGLPLAQTAARQRGSF